MNDPASLVALSASFMLAIGLAAAVGLRGWTDWLEVRRLDPGGRRRGLARSAPGRMTELAELRERVRRLEAIANGAEV
jgi:hypothetical protein